MRRLRQERRSKFEKGGSAAMFCRAKTQASRRAFPTRYVPFIFTKNRRSLSFETPPRAFSRYTPFRALSIADSLTSVAKIWTGGLTRVSPMYSRSEIAIEEH